MSVPAPVLVPELVRLGQTVLQVVQDVRQTAARTDIVTAVAQPGYFHVDDVLADVSLQAQRLLIAERAARNRVSIALQRARQQERDATHAATTLARSAPSAEAASADPAAMVHMTRAQSLRRDIEALTADLAQAEAQVVVVQDFLISLERTRDDVNRSIAALHREHERALRLAELTALTDGVSQRMATVDQLTAQVDDARARIEADGEARQLRPGVGTFLAHGRLRAVEAADELARLREQR
jgi:hypothetical protein